MPRYALKVSYDGLPFSGFQWQNHALSVQEVLETAMKKLEPASGRLVAAGRTDAGVHAMGQIVHFDLEREWEPYRLAEAMNYHTKPYPVVILAAAKVGDEFSARFSALKRRYLYRVICRKARPTYMRGRIWHVRQKLDLLAMREAAAHLIGHHDFTTFRSSGCQSASPIKSLDRLDIEAVETSEGYEIRFHVEARSFLHNQVRSFVGTLERVGAGSWQPDAVQSALVACDRARCGPVAPPDGLYLAHVDYGRDLFEEGYRDF